MALSVIIPANNEADFIETCLSAVLASENPAPDAPEPALQVIVVANGCSDKTADLARQMAPAFAAKSWQLDVLDLPEGGKMNALNKGDGAAVFETRAYLDADVTISPPLLRQLVEALSVDTPRYASGTPDITEAETWATRAYRRIYRKVPFVKEGVPGFGIFAVNAAGRQRWGLFPDIISDDTFVRLSFTPEERIGVPATHKWPMVEGFQRLVKVRRRQDQGVEEIKQRFPRLLENDDKRRISKGEMLAMALRDPLGFAVYVSVALAVKFTKSSGRADWARGR